MALGGFWVISGLYIDLSYHLRNDAESFFTPAHAFLYAGLGFLIFVTALVVLARRQEGRSGRDLLPEGYQVAGIGIAVFSLGGVADLIGHTFLGFETAFNALLSPSHETIGVGIMLMMVGPLRAALLVAPRPATLAQQLPLLIAAASLLELVRWGTHYLFLSGAERLYAPYAEPSATQEALTIMTLAFNKQGTGLTSLIVESLFIVGIMLYLVRNFRLRPGALTLVFVLGTLLIAFAESTSWLQAWGFMIASVFSGVAGDLIVARTPDIRANRARYAMLAIAVPVIFEATCLLWVIAFLGGTWWSPSFAIGSLVYCGIFSLLLSYAAYAETSEAR